MKINLLVEIVVFFWSFIAARITRVVKSGIIDVPGQAAPGGWILNARHHIRKLPSGFHVEDIHGTRFAAGLRKRRGHVFAIVRGDVKINGGGSFVVQNIGIQHHAFGGWIVRGCKQNKIRLFFGRLRTQRKKPGRPRLQVEVIVLGVAVEPRQAVMNFFPDGAAGKIVLGVTILCAGPTTHLGVGPIFQPLIVITNRHSVIGAGHGNSRGLGNKQGRTAVFCDESARGEEAGQQT